MQRSCSSASAKIRRSEIAEACPCSANRSIAARGAITSENSAATNIPLMRIKKAIVAFVFEPNDANTWAKVRSMIESFLVRQWRDGALTGAKPDDAFYVSVGLNKTMTAQDILDGYMIVEIGMAIVRPAEFIVLRFAQMMQKS